MKKAVPTLLMLTLVAALCLLLVSPVKGNFKTFVTSNNYSTNSVAIDNATNGETIFVRCETLPSPLSIATLTISLVALFGAIPFVYLKFEIEN